VNYSEYMATNYDIVNLLRRLGLNQYEAKAYFALASFGNHTAGELSERAELPRPRVYDVLTRLQDKGFVLIQQGRPVKYAALPIQEAMKTLKKQRQAALEEEINKIEEIGKELQSKLKPARKNESAELGEKVWTLKGREAIYSKAGAMIAGAKKEVILASTPEKALQKIKALSKELESARKKGVKIHVVSQGNEGEITKIASTFTNKILPTRMLLADDQILFYLTDEKTAPEDELGVWLHSPHLVQTIKQSINAKT